MTISLALVVELLKELLNYDEEFGIEVEEVYGEEQSEDNADCAHNSDDCARPSWQTQTDKQCPGESDKCRSDNHICLLTLPSLFVLHIPPHRAHP